MKLIFRRHTPLLTEKMLPSLRNPNRCHVLFRSFADAKNFAAPSILEDKPGKSTALPQEIWEQVRSSALPTPVF